MISNQSKIAFPCSIPIMTGKIIFYLREYFFPSGCGGCGRSLIPVDSDKDDVYYGLCKSCRDFFEASSNIASRCSYCGKHLISEKDTCMSCRNSGALEIGRFNEQLVRVKSIFPYAGNFKIILGAFKFGKSLGIGYFFARYLAISIRAFDFFALNNDAALVPVPPRPFKIKKTGWDQVEFLAKALEKKHNMRVSRCLKRLESQSQKVLNRSERKSNLKGRILCVKNPPKTAVLFDDVITTGATLDACAKALLEGGAERVYAVCLFYD